MGLLSSYPRTRNVSITSIFAISSLLLSLGAFADSRLQNIATRALVKTGDEVLIGGFVISGTEPKTVVIRARGPALATAGVSGALTNPQVALFSGADMIDSNNDWQTHPNANLIPEDLRPVDPTEAVIVATLQPGAYTAIVSGVADEVGVGLVEIFELTDTGATRLTNIAARSFVGTGDDVMIGGLVINGTEPKWVVVRAKGPSLTEAGVPGVLMNPRMRLFSGSTLVDGNFDWQNDVYASSMPEDLKPTNAQEAAIYTQLAPGPYTIIVSGEGDTTGVGIVEVFEVDAQGGIVSKACDVCPVMVEIPGGTFEMGYLGSEGGGWPGELPAHEVTVPAFAMGKFEVTFDEYDAFANDTGSPLPDDRGWGRGARPVINVSWYDAQEYVAWLNDRTGLSFRLPSESEWEYAARAGTKTTFHFGYGLTCVHANHVYVQSCRRSTSPVGDYPANRFGLHDVHGNVYEWVQDCYEFSYSNAPIDGSAREDGSCSDRVLRGGSFNSDGYISARSASRWWNLPSLRDYYIGFRVAQDI